MNVAVVGAGWAGLSAAVRLKQQGHAVVVFEAGRTLGGRARRVYSPKLKANIDNGQHILLGAYTSTLALMEQLGLDTSQHFYRSALTLESADGSFSLSAAALPAPFHLLSAIVRARGLSPREKFRLGALMLELKKNKWQVQQGTTVAQWLSEGKQAPQVIRNFWHPLCIAALNTAPEHACAGLFAKVLQDSVGGTASATDILIPKADLSELWPDAAGQYIATGTAQQDHLRMGCPVRTLSRDAKGVLVNGLPFDAVIIAGNTPATARLLNQLSPCATGERYLAMLSAITFLPIATVTLELEHAWRLPQAMLLLRDDPAKLHYGQWLFDRSSFTGDSANKLLHVVISEASQMQLQPRVAVIAAITEQLQMQTRRFGPMPRIVNHEVVIEKRATFAAVPCLARPSNATPWPQVWVAGDWTDTGYPGVLEGAVRSGLRAADMVNETRH